MPETYLNLAFTAEPIQDRAYGKRFNVYVNTKGTGGRGRFFGTLRRISENSWEFITDDKDFGEVVNENIGVWVYKNKGSVAYKDVLFAVKYSYIVHYHEEEVYPVGDEMEVIDEAFLMGTQRDVEEALGIR